MRRVHCTVCAGLVALSVLGSVGTQVHAQSRHGGQKPASVRGLLLTVGTQSVTVRTSSGTRTVPLLANTRVTRQVSGTAIDLRAGEIVDLQLKRGTLVVQAARINNASPLPAPRTGGRAHPPHGPAQIVSISGTSLTVRLADGATSTYSLAPDVHVTELLPGRASDLAVGQTVMIRMDRSDSAAGAVTILDR